MCSTSQMFSLVVHVTKSSLDRKKTSLVFLPGKSEIASVFKDLVAAGVAKELIVPFHADLDVDEIEEAKRGTKHARIMLSTSLAETSITLPDVDVVIDFGLSRRCFFMDSISMFVDFNFLLSPRNCSLLNAS